MQVEGKNAVGALQVLMNRLSISCDMPTIQMMSREMRKTPENAAEEPFGELSLPGIGNLMKFSLTFNSSTYKSFYGGSSDT